MDNLYKRYALFLGLCIGTRIMLAVLAKVLPPEWLRIMGYITIIPGLGFLSIYLSGARKRGGEVFGDKIWWNSLRPLHGLLYLVFSYLAITGDKSAWQVLALDVFIGLLAFVNEHFIS